MPQAVLSDGTKLEIVKESPATNVEIGKISSIGEIGFGEAESLTGAEAVHGMKLLLRHCGVSEDGAEKCILRDITEMTRVVLRKVTGKRRFQRR